MKREKRLTNWMKRNKSLSILVIMLSLVFGLMFTEKVFLNPGTNTNTTDYSIFQEDLENGKVQAIEYNYSKEKMVVTLEDNSTYVTDFPAYEDFRKDMLEAGIKLSIADIGTSFTDIVSLMINLLFYGFIGIFMFKMVKEMVGTDFSEKTLLQTSNVKFSDIIGQDEIVNDIQFAANILKNPDMGEEFGAKPPKGILFEGGPGCGKTMIAKAIAGEANVPFISISGSSFVEKYVGVGAQRVRKVFNLAKKNAPCVIFIDEIDAVGCERGTGGNSEREQTINALLTEMDGFTGRDGILVIAATNRADMLDEALVRSGRFDKKITISKPKNWSVRAELFQHYLKGKKLSEDVDIDCLAKQTSNYTGADIAAACNEASLIALQKGLSYINMDCLEEAIDKKVFCGNRVKSKEEKNHDKEIVAYHEAGHAVITYLLDKPIARASIIGTTSGVGGAVFREDTDSQFMTKKDMIDSIMIAYGGRVSEEIKFGLENITTGASSDITQATKMLAGAVMRYGFYTDTIGMLDINVLKEYDLLTNENEALQLIKEESSRIYKEVLQLLKENYNLVELLAEKLIDVEVMPGSTIKDLLDENKVLS